jgi:hypothetical protein
VARPTNGAKILSSELIFQGCVFALKRSLQGLLFLLLLARPLSSQSLPNEPKCTAQGRGKLQLTTEDTTILGLTIGVPLKAVREKLGPANSLPTHGFASASNTICYVSPDGTVLTFGAGAMGGFTDVTEFALWSHGEKFPNVSMCGRSSLVSAALATESGIRLGLNEIDLTKIVRKKPAVRQNTASYDFLCAVKMTRIEIDRFSADGSKDDPFFDLTSRVQVRFSNGAASHIEIYKGESY